MNTITINQNEYGEKYLSRIVLGKQAGAYLRKKEKVLFSAGIGIISFQNGQLKRVTTEEETKNHIDFILYDKPNSINEVLFRNEQYPYSWKQLFVYLFDEEGAMLIYGTRGILGLGDPEVGVYYDVVGISGKENLRQQAINVAEILMPGLSTEIFTLEEKLRQEDKLSLIEGFLEA